LKRKKYLHILLLLGILLAIFYCNLYFQKGILFEDSFLKLSKGINGYEYSGTAYGEHIQIIAKEDIKSSNTTAITYSIGDWYYKTYTVNVLKSSAVNTDINIYENNNLLFEGTYKRNSGFLLWDKKGEPVWDITTTFNNQSPFNAAYNVSKSEIVTTAFKNNIMIRGNGALLVLAIFIILYLAIDIKWPRLIFMWRHSLSVNNPEPSDFYLAAQRMSWYVGSLITLCILIASLFVH